MSSCCLAVAMYFFIGLVMGIRIVNRHKHDLASKWEGAGVFLLILFLWPVSVVVFLVTEFKKRSK